MIDQCDILNRCESMDVPLVSGERPLPFEGVNFKLVRNTPEVMEVVSAAEAIHQPHMLPLCLYNTGWVYTTEASSGFTLWLDCSPG